MSRPRRISIAAALAVASSAWLAAGADATELKHHKHMAHAYHARAKVVTGSVHRDDFLDVGEIPDPGSDQRYFNDTKSAGYELGPTIFERFENSLNTF
jgi:hypothetical protein